MEKKKTKKLVLRKLAVSKLNASELAGVVGGPPSRTDCDPLHTLTCSVTCLTQCPANTLYCDENPHQ